MAKGLGANPWLRRDGSLTGRTGCGVEAPSAGRHRMRRSPCGHANVAVSGRWRKGWPRRGDVRSEAQATGSVRLGDGRGVARRARGRRTDAGRALRPERGAAPRGAPCADGRPQAPSRSPVVLALEFADRAVAGDALERRDLPLITPIGGRMSDAGVRQRVQAGAAERHRSIKDQQRDDHDLPQESRHHLNSRVVSSAMWSQQNPQDTTKGPHLVMRYGGVENLRLTSPTKLNIRPHPSDEVNG